MRGSQSSALISQRRVGACRTLVVWAFVVAAAARPQAQAPVHDHDTTNAAAGETWTLMQDGILFAEFNHQGGPRGGNEFVAPNWWMGMAHAAMRRADG